ncbi:hypothetical protein GIB67_016733 [Kingdonia uniflora]|uniref:non-specific serine/threonine protein kinase n=1 Tax=Kingdonia uniflora TaxID=39325 RepID=A0A7J7LMN4_9MAGN|nr:hypothetical protein GIB67_016733 [Kingdonia uniflora]
MGHSSKKKKRGGHGGRKSKGRVVSKDHHASHDDSELLTEELTAMHAIFQEDFRIVSESPPGVSISVRPYSKDLGSEDLNVSALLSVRCLPGYPYKCPKLKITPEKGLSKEDADNLLSLLYDQANFNAREGRVMIFNLVEAAQEFLSEIVPAGLPNESIFSARGDKTDNWLHGDTTTAKGKSLSSRGPYIYGLVDLFSDYKDTWDWGSVTDKSKGSHSLILSRRLDASSIDEQAKKMGLFPNENLNALQDTKKGPIPEPSTKLETLKEESASDSNSISLNPFSRSFVEESSSDGSTSEDHDLKEPVLEKELTKLSDTDFDSEPSDSVCSVPDICDQDSEPTEKDLIMVHLLRLACSAKGPLSDALPDITSELYNLGILSERVVDLATKPQLLFNESFNHVFRQHVVSSPNSHFWKGTADFGAQSTLPSSRYRNDFEELSSLGHGGFGHVALCKNKLDGRQYAVKKILLKDKSLPVDDRILREVATLSRLQHQHVVRYYQAWFEAEVDGNLSDSVWGSRTGGSSSYSYVGPSSAVDSGPENKLESTYLYIQMEYCPRTLRQVFESYNSVFGKEFVWHLFRQIVEGLAHIHAQGIIHRDLTPSNIFFDARNDIKIGDFGLAKFFKLEQLDQDTFPTDTTGVSVDGTGQVGTYFYTAPEVEQGWPKIDEKVDMYSLGVVFFELWHPFGTAMERHVILSDLKQKGSLPPSWVAEFPEQATLLQRLMSPSPSNRPSATEILQNALPPRMEDEWLVDVLRAIQSPDDTHVYEKVVQKIFDEERLTMKTYRQHGVRVSLAREESSFIQYSELETELRDYVIEVVKEVFGQHCAKRMEITSMRLLDGSQQFNRNSVKLLTHEGDMLELCHELRLPFANWITAKQGDFDIVGGASALTEAEIIKVVMEIVTRFFNSDSCHIRLNHADLLDAIWSWVGVEVGLRESVAQRLSVMGSLRPQSAERKSSWFFVRRQLLQDLNLAEVVVNRLQTVDLRFCGFADQALPRLMGALPPDKYARKALEELSALFGYLRVWDIEKNIFIDALMPPTENYHRELFFQVFADGNLLATGGRYDHVLHQMWDLEYKSNPPGAVGTSIALETILHSYSVEVKPSRNEASIPVLICSRAGGGMLVERMKMAAELWQANIKAAFVPMSDPSFTEQYEYANGHDIKCLVIMTPSQTILKVRHLELKKEKEVEKDDLVKFLAEATVTPFRNLSIWN